MKKVTAGICAMLLATAAYAGCRYWTVTISGKTYYCSECCYGNICSTTCN